MKIIKKIFVFVSLFLLLAGCLQVETTIKVKKDGSGTINEKVLFSKTFVNMMKEFVYAFQDSVSTEEFTIFEESDIKADAKDYGENVAYVSHEMITDEKWEGYKAVYSFDDITKLKISPDPDSKIDIADEEGETAEQKEYYFFNFIKGDTPELIIDRPPIELTSKTDKDRDSTESEQENEENGEEFIKMMEGMKVDIAVEVDGEIINTNASYVQNSRITLFQIDLGEMMKNKEAFKEFQNNEPENIEEMKEFIDKFPGMKIEVEKPVSVKFK